MSYGNIAFFYQVFDIEKSHLRQTMSKFWYINKVKYTIVSYIKKNSCGKYETNPVEFDQTRG